jgi:hypothetical protein
LCREAPALITLGQLSIKDAIGLITQLEERISGKEGDGDGEAMEKKLRNFLTLSDSRTEDKKVDKKRIQ